MHTLPSEVSESIGTSTAFAAWNAAIYVAQVEDDRLAEVNVLSQLANVCRTTVVRDAWSRGQSLTVHGWIYDIDCMHVFDGDGPGVLCFELDPTTQHAEDVRRGLLEILRDLRRSGTSRRQMLTCLLVEFGPAEIVDSVEQAQTPRGNGRRGVTSRRNP